MVKVRVKKSASWTKPFPILLFAAALLLMTVFLLKGNQEKVTTSATVTKPLAATHKLSNFDGETVSLRNSVMPAVGYGTCCRKSAKGEAIYTSTLMYLKLGGRLIDTAMAYRNHEEIGRAVRDSGLARDEVWITGKVSPNAIKGKDMYQKTMDAIDTMLKELNVGSYLDLCLIHSPKLGEKGTIQMWMALIKAQTEGKIRSIGVSNFNKQEILDLQSRTGILPEVNQIQYHPWTSNEWKALVQWQAEMGIVTTAYNSLGGSRFHSANKGNINKWPSSITELAQQHHVTEAQLLLRWALNQENISVIPGATSEAHIRDNLHVPQFMFDLDALEQTDVPPTWFDSKRGPVKYRAEEAAGRAWTGNHEVPKL